MDCYDEEFVYLKKIQTKGKTKSFLPKSDVLELMVRTGRQGKCVGAAPEVFTAAESIKIAQPQNFTFISNNIWFHLANYIAPEDIKNYSLICTQSASSINSRYFWKQLYRRYCQQSTGNSKRSGSYLPPNLQIDRLRSCDGNNLRPRVIQALYRCYPHFQKRLNTPYPLDILKGRVYISSWRKSIHSKLLMCYKFQLVFTPSANKKWETKTAKCDKIGYSGTTVENWECLADETIYNCCEETQSYSTFCNNNLEGVFLLIINSERFSPLPIMCNHDADPLRFAAGRVLLSSDMKSEDLELKFISNISRQIVTVKYLKVHEFQVLPWWHPLFEKYL